MVFFPTFIEFYSSIYCSIPFEYTLLVCILKSLLMLYSVKYKKMFFWINNKPDGCICRFLSCISFVSFSCIFMYLISYTVSNCHSHKRISLMPCFYNQSIVLFKAQEYSFLYKDSYSYITYMPTFKIIFQHHFKYVNESIRCYD